MVLCLGGGGLVDVYGVSGIWLAGEDTRTMLSRVGWIKTHTGR
jgi:hypothetical protein